VGEVSGYNAFKGHIAEQMAQSEQVLAHHFDPQRLPQDRPDRLLKTREFVALLAFYLDRAVRYHLFEPDAAAEAHALLTTLERGYRLQFTRSALIFDFDKPGTEPAVHEGGIEYHRVGKDLIHQLIEAARALARTSEDAVQTSASEESARPRTLSEQELSVPRLRDAAFLGTSRARHTWPGMHEPEGGADMRSLSAPTDRDEATRAVVENEPEPVAIANESSTTTETLAALPQAAEEIPEQQRARSAARATDVPYDILLGTTTPSPQYGILGEMAGRKIALDLNETHTMSSNSRRSTKPSNHRDIPIAFS
jgi:hypothetical protein